MGHAGLSSLLVVLLPLLLTSLHPTTAARLPGQNTDEIDPPFDPSTLDGIIDTICNETTSVDPETASIIKAKLRESPGFSPSEDAMTDDRTVGDWLDNFCKKQTDNTTDPTTTDSTTVSTTDSTPTTTDSTTVSATDSITTTTDEAPTSSSTEPSTTSSSSETPPLEDLELYTKTHYELSQITTTLDAFIALVNTVPEAAHVESVVSARRVWGARDLPVAWWQRKKSSRPRADMNFCEEGSPNTNCDALEIELQEIDTLVVQLTEDVDAWQQSDLTDLTDQRVNLNTTYQAALEDNDFVQSVDSTKFMEAVGAVQDNVESGSSAVQGKIDELSPLNDSGSIALVATLGSVGGLMVVSLIGVTIYGAVQKSKTKKKLSSAKPKREDIPIDAYAHDAPGSRPPPKTNPYSPEPVPAPRNHHHPGQFDPRREPVYPEPINGRPQQGLRRTNY